MRSNSLRSWLVSLVGYREKTSEEEERDGFRVLKSATNGLFLAGLLDALGAGVEGTLALGLFEELLLGLGLCWWVSDMRCE